ncbi:solute carrier family 35 member E1 homolog [Trichonephila inaurata madagascariensis]|uniref:Solute carrier family 35 member E1 homolog n=1 Tax=Trichonephila inaurata madagascariensis TaxID=2747483 RepID=A0A8X7C9A5_9ARAC|nr:solute carrier family 35 member E1 homolog [Trichonephila inaurata madagascariensis]
MASDSQAREILYVVVLCFIWYGVSSGNGVILKTVLNDFPYPITVTMVQLLTATLLSGPLFSLWGIRTVVDINRTYYWKLIVPLAFGKFFASVSSHVSIWKVPVSYAHTVKATMPLFTVILSRIILHEKQTTKVYLSLIPIVIGVLIATASEISFNMIGLISALLATMGFSLQHTFSKKVLCETNIHHLRLLHILARLAFLYFLPVWLIYDCRTIMYDDNLFQGKDKFTILFLLFADGLCNFAQNIVAFSLISLVSPLTYSVCNTAKRISVIGVSLILLGNPVTALNFFGMMLAIFGVLLYNKAKYDANQAKLKAATLPYIAQKESVNLLLKYGDDHHNAVIGKLYPSTVPKKNGYVRLHQMMNGSPNLQNV